MGRKHCGKGQIARYEQFLLYPQCFQKAYFQGASKGVIEWEWVNPFLYQVLTSAKKEGISNIVGQEPSLTDYAPLTGLFLGSEGCCKMVGYRRVG